MLGSQSQYIFVHDALVEYVKSDFILSIKKAKLKQHLDELRTEKPNSTGTGMEREFQVGKEHALRPTEKIFKEHAISRPLVNFFLSMKEYLFH